MTNDRNVDDLAELTITELVIRYGDGELTAEEFHAEIDRRAPLMVEAEIREEREARARNRWWHR